MAGNKIQSVILALNAKGITKKPALYTGIFASMAL